MDTEASEIEAALSPKPIEGKGRETRVGRDGLGYIWATNIGKDYLYLRIDYLQTRNDEVTGEITVKVNDAHVCQDRVCINDMQSRERFIQGLQRKGGPDLPWADRIERFCMAVLYKEREGDEYQWTEHADYEPVDYVIDQIAIRNKTNTLFAPGGSGKGIFCCGLCVALTSNHGLGSLTTMPAKPLYLDWEEDYRTFAQRLSQVSRGMGVATPRIPYQKMRGLLANRINRVAQIVQETGTDFIIVDSFSAAGGTVTANNSWDSIAHRFFDACDLIPNVTWFIIDHVTGENVSKQILAAKAFGSVQKHNRVRNAWGMTSKQDPGSPISIMQFYDGKWNHTGHRSSFGMQLTFKKDSVVFADTNVRDEAMVLSQLPRQVSDYIDRFGPKSIETLAVELDVEENLVRQMLTADAKMGRISQRFSRRTDGLIRNIRDEPRIVSNGKTELKHETYSETQLPSMETVAEKVSEESSEDTNLPW